MLTLGPTETLQLVDGSEQLPVMRCLVTVSEVVALAAPALAAVADAYLAAEEQGARGLMNRLDGVLRDCIDSDAPGLLLAAPRYRLLPFSKRAIDPFSRIREILGEDDLFLTQTYAVAYGADVPLLLIDGGEARRRIDLLNASGIAIQVRWIEG